MTVTTEEPPQPEIKPSEEDVTAGPFQSPCDLCWYAGDKSEKTVVWLDGVIICRPCCSEYLGINR